MPVHKITRLIFDMVKIKICIIITQLQRISAKACLTAEKLVFFFFLITVEILT